MEIKKILKKCKGGFYLIGFLFLFELLIIININNLGLFGIALLFAPFIFFAFLSNITHNSTILYLVGFISYFLLGCLIGFIFRKIKEKWSK